MLQRDLSQVCLCVKQQCVRAHSQSRRRRHVWIEAQAWCSNARALTERTSLSVSHEQAHARGNRRLGAQRPMIAFLLSVLATTCAVVWLQVESATKATITFFKENQHSLYVAKATRLAFVRRTGKQSQARMASSNSSLLSAIMPHFRIRPSKHELQLMFKEVDLALNISGLGGAADNAQWAHGEAEVLHRLLSWLRERMGRSETGKSQIYTSSRSRSRSNACCRRAPRLTAARMATRYRASPATTVMMTPQMMAATFSCLTTPSSGGHQTMEKAIRKCVHTHVKAHDGATVSANLSVL